MKLSESNKPESEPAAAEEGASKPKDAPSADSGTLDGSPGSTDTPAAETTPPEASATGDSAKPDEIGAESKPDAPSVVADASKPEGMAVTMDGSKPDDAGDKVKPDEPSDVSEDPKPEETSATTDEGKPDAGPREKATASSDGSGSSTWSPGTPPPPPPPPPAKRGFFPLLLGGIIAGGIGYGAHMYLSDTQAPDDRSEEAIAALRAELEALQAQVSEPAPEPDLSAIEAELDELRTALAERPEPDQIVTGDVDLSAIEAEIAELRSALAERPESAEIEEALGEVATVDFGPIEAQVEAVADSVAAMEARFDELQAEFADLRDLSERRVTEAEAAVTEAETAVDLALARSGLQIMRAALDGGYSYADAIGLFNEAGVEVPDELAEPAETGVPTREALQEMFPAAARAALREEFAQAPAATAYDRFSNFLRAQTGARSTAPREGDDADAILSRAGAAVEEDDLDTALEELAALDEPALSAMQDWQRAAQHRLAVEATLPDFADSLSNE